MGIFLRGIFSFSFLSATATVNIWLIRDIVAAESRSSMPARTEKDTIHHLTSVLVGNSQPPTSTEFLIRLNTPLPPQNSHHIPPPHLFWSWTGSKSTEWLTSAQTLSHANHRWLRDGPPWTRARVISFEFGGEERGEHPPPHTHTKSHQ